MLEQTIVVHTRDKQQYGADYVYCGRPSKWGNPFVEGRDGNHDEVIAKHRKWLFSRRPDLVLAAREELKGRALGCYCAPQTCHCDVLAQVANLSEAEFEKIVVAWWAEHNVVLPPPGPVYFGNGEHTWLHNFSRRASVVQFDQDIVIGYPTAEHAYQAQRLAAAGNEELAWTLGEDLPDPLAAAQFVRGYAAAVGFEESEQDRLTWMWYALGNKLSRDDELKQLLLATQDRPIIELSKRGDTFWGVTLEGEGRNELGKIWMKLRAELQDAQKGGSSFRKAA